MITSPDGPELGPDPALVASQSSHSSVSRPEASIRGNGLAEIMAHNAELRARKAELTKSYQEELGRLQDALAASGHRIGCAAIGLDPAIIDEALTVLNISGSYARGGLERESVIRDAVDWLATGKCAAYYGLNNADFGTKNYDRWTGQRSDHEWGGPKHGWIVFQVGLKDRKRELTERERDAAIYLLLNIEKWEAARTQVAA